MKKIIYLFAFILLFSFILSAQLTDMQKAAMGLYIQSHPELSKYNKGIGEKILTDPGVITEVKSCWSILRIYAGLEKSRNMEDLSEIYSELGQSVPEQRNKFLPDFNKTEYRQLKADLQGHTLKIDASKHTELLKHYYAGRKDKLNADNAFGSMIIQYPELMENLRKAIDDAYFGKPDDARMILWLEMNYYQQMRLNVIKQIAIEEDKIREQLKSCLSSFHEKFEEAMAKEDGDLKKWTGMFSNENLSLKFEQSRGYIFASSVKSIGSATESSQWNLSVKGNSAEGEWLVFYTDNDKKIQRSGTMTIKLDGDIMTFDMLGTDWKIEWKEGVKPYPTETAETTKGIRMTGTLTRKN